MSQPAEPNGKGRRKNPWNRAGRDDRRKRRLFMEPLERREMLAVAIDQITAFPPHPTYKSPATPIVYLSGPQSGDPVTIATNYIRNNAASFGIAPTDANHLLVTNNYVSSGLRNIYFVQTYNGLPIANANVNVSMLPDGRILTAGVSLVPGLVEPAPNPGPTPYITSTIALQVVATASGVNLNTTATTISSPTGRNMHTVLRNTQLSTKDIIAELQYVPKAGGGVQLAWRINVDMRDGAHWYDASVGADLTAPARLVNVVDWTDTFMKTPTGPAAAGEGSSPGFTGGGSSSGGSAGFAGGSSFADGTTYNVYPMPIESPLHGSRALTANPSDTGASPFGWQDTNGVVGPESTKTRGNNVNAQDDTDDNDTGGVSPDGTAALLWDFPIDFTQNASSYLDASTVNLYYWINIAHDVSFEHGFDEVSGNFQVKNYSNQGAAGDPVEADSQDGSGTNNANMSTPPDGQSPREQQYIFDVTNPTRDSSLDSGIVVHEFTHGISNRLTGGPANANALNALQSGGMGEGWSDWMGLMLTQKPGDTANQARGIGMWVLGQPLNGPGVRRAPYSFDMAINPRTLGDFNQSNEVHDAGEAWCSALWDMNWLMINRLGYDPNIYTGGGGNNLAMDIVLLGMKLQPANPTFCDARDAILAADQVLTGGDNFEEIWTAFARRGFGLSANCGANANSTTVVEAFDKPAPPVKIGGIVFNDESGNGIRDPNELPLQGWRVYVDTNNNKVFDTGERSTLSAADGSYQLSLFVTGAINVREVVQPLWKETFPGGDGGYHITVSAGDNIGNLRFANQEFPGEIHGRKWSDVDGDGVMDFNEPGIQGVVIYIDVNNDGKIGIGEPAAVTDQFGNYTIINIRPGTFTVREVYQPGFVQTFPDPAGPGLGAHTGVVVTTGAVTPNINFGNKAAFDYGDAPAPYPTLKSQNGAVHGILQGFRLGAAVDAEPDGQPSVGAVGDDFSGNEAQRVTIPALTTAGTFTLTFGTQTTAPIAFNANASAVRTALEALSNIGAGQVLVTGGAGPGNPWVVTFQGTLANQNVNQLTGNGSLLTPVGVVTVATQQNGGIDDEDGVILGNIIPGQTATATVTSSVGSFAAGYLQAFVDFNRDGDWNDTGEQIFKDVQLTNGTVVLPFNVPASASLGVTYARFRFSLEHGIGPTGSALGGEVEDYATNLLGVAPTAINDSFTVDDGSLFFQNPLNVLANDLPSAVGPAGIDPAGLDLTGTQGQVVLDDNGTPGNITDDFYRYQPPAGFVGVDTFQYRDKDPSGNVSAPATVTVTVRFVPRDPIAVDNTFDVLKDSLASVNKLDVMANDVLGTGGAVRFLTQTPPTALHGTVTVDTNGTPTNFNDDFYRYAPNPGYQGEDSFTYTIVDSLAKQSTGNVTVQVLAAPRTPFTGALIQFELQIIDKNTGLQIPDGALIPIGTSILVRGVISDIRPPGSAFDPSQGIDFAGAFSGYMDLLFDRTKVQAFGPIVFGPQYPDSQSGFGGTPGLIDEIGAAHLAQTAPSNPATVFTKEFLTVGSGNVQFVADPADISPAHDITAFIVDPNPLNSKVQPIPPSQVYYKPTFSNISILGAGEGDDTNLWTPTDVNLDGFVTPIDALLVVNYLNEHLGDPAASGEGSTGAKRDVNHDNQISPIDALMVINYLNRPKPVVPAGEAEGEADDAVPLSPLVFSSSTLSGSSDTSSGTEPSAPVYAASVDQIFAQTDWTRPSVNRSEDFVSSQTGSGSDDFFADLGTSVRRNRKG